MRLHATSAGSAAGPEAVGLLGVRAERRERLPLVARGARLPGPGLAAGESPEGGSGDRVRVVGVLVEARGGGADAVLGSHRGPIR